jgi:flagellar basal-body rod protein FlgG
MLDSLFIGATGMQAQQTQVDVISNNLANVNTMGFKRNRVSFEDLLYRGIARTNGIAGSQLGISRLGVGTAVSATGKVFVDGDLKETDAPLDVAIQGDGFIEVELPDGSSAYTRAGSLQVNADGLLTTIDGDVLHPDIRIPSDATAISIDKTGKVTATVPNESAAVDVGQIEMARFVNPGGLNPIGKNLYVANDKSGDAIIGKPGDSGFGTLSQGFLETSNVKLIEEMVNLVVAQRAYEINSKVVQAADEMLGLSNNLRR